MTKFPAVKSQKLVKALQKMGFFGYHRVGSHVQFKHLDGRRTTVPVHSGKDIPRGTLRAVLKQINILPEEFRDVL